MILLETRKMVLVVFLDYYGLLDYFLTQLRVDQDMSQWGGWEAFLCHETVIQESGLFPYTMEDKWTDVYNHFNLEDMRNG